MNTIKCKYNWDDGTVEVLFSDGTTVALLCKGIEADLSIGIKAQGKLNALKIEKPSEYAVMALNGTLQDYCDTIDPFQQHKPKHALRAVQRALSRYERRADAKPYP